jgi:hypothetical protein
MNRIFFIPSHRHRAGAGATCLRPSQRRGLDSRREVAHGIRSGSQPARFGRGETDGADILPRRLVSLLHRHLSDLAGIEPGPREGGAQLLAISMDKPENFGRPPIATSSAIGCFRTAKRWRRRPLASRSRSRTTSSRNTRNRTRLISRPPRARPTTSCRIRRYSWRTRKAPSASRT